MVDWEKDLVTRIDLTIELLGIEDKESVFVNRNGVIQIIPRFCRCCGEKIW